ncbi:MAG TPA: hypothetical protein PKE16_09850, partial [Hyphomicrobium sp.]|nr:hypothetical protein [Hyphomicrobium sp.]
MVNSAYTLAINGRELPFDLEVDAFAAAAKEFDTRGEGLEISIAMGGAVYIGPLQMRHWWKMKRQGTPFRDI